MFETHVLDYFYRLSIPWAVSRYFGLAKIRTGLVGVSTCEGVAIGYSTRISPVFRRLPMGLSWAMLFAQKAHENILVSAGLSREQRLVDGCRAPALEADVWAANVDNCAIFSLSQDRAEAWRIKLQGKMDQLGLDTHEVVTATQDTDLLGHHIDGKGMTLLSLKPSRYWKIRQATLGLLDRGRCTGQELSVLLGHLTYAFLLNRPLLSIFAACYVFVDKHRHRRVRMWPSVAKELANAVGLLPLAYADLKAT
eukprot:2033156-Amphidinium_carterae.1